MKNVIYAVAFVCMVLLIPGAKKPSCATGEVCSCSVTVEREKAILKVHDALIAAAEKRDVETMFGYILENDKGAIAQDGRLLSRKEAMEQIRQVFEGIVGIQYNFEQRNIKMLSPKIGLMTATGTTTVTVDTGESFTTPFANTSVFVFQEDGWKIIHGHHSIPNRN